MQKHLKRHPLDASVAEVIKFLQQLPPETRVCAYADGAHSELDNAFTFLEADTPHVLFIPRHVRLEDVQTLEILR